MEHNHLGERPVDVEKHPKQDFQVERLAFFSDAVFAIAITLLVIEFKVPHITDNTTFRDACNQLFDLKYHLIALLMSFWLITIYWKDHHFLFKHIHNYNTPIIFANMLTLLPIIFFPFTSTFFAECFANFFNQNNTEIFVLGFRIFALNNALAALAISVFYWLVMIKYKEMSYNIPAKERIDFIWFAWFRIIFFTVIFVVTFITKNISFIDGLMLIVIIFARIFRKTYKKRLAEK